MYNSSKPRGLTVEEMQITTADGAAGNLEDDISGFDDSWFGYLDYDTG